MLSVIVQGNGMVEVHKAGCADIAKRYGRHGFTNQLGSIQAVYDEYLDTGDANEPGYTEDEFKFYPCTKGA
jgi:hypothetical protein